MLTEFIMHLSERLEEGAYSLCFSSSEPDLQTSCCAHTWVRSEQSQHWTPTSLPHHYSNVFACRKALRLALRRKYYSPKNDPLGLWCPFLFDNAPFR